MGAELICAAAVFHDDLAHGHGSPAADGAATDTWLDDGADCGGRRRNDVYRPGPEQRLHRHRHSQYGAGAGGGLFSVSAQ